MKATLLPAVFAAALLAGCAAQTIKEARPYPQGTPYGPSLDIQVFRRTTEIEFTNTTARPFGASILWLNGRFARPVAGLEVGQHVVLPLREFTDEYGESFRAGGFFATEAPDRLALAEIETVEPDGKTVMLGLVVVGGEAP
ncbi:MAG: hypothetical protein WD749_01835 [Phycisphaerales bacterium]